MRIYSERQRMQKSKCHYCVRAWYPDPKDENKGVWGYGCEIDEWDSDTVCKPHQCHYYRKEADDAAGK